MKPETVSKKCHAFIENTHTDTEVNSPLDKNVYKV